MPVALRTKNSPYNYLPQFKSIGLLLLKPTVALKRISPTNDRLDVPRPVCISAMQGHDLPENEASNHAMQCNASQESTPSIQSQMLWV